MNDNPSPIVHIAPRVQAHGGIETVLAYNREAGAPQVFVALFDRHPEPRPDYVNLGFTWRTPLWLMRRRFRRALATYRGSFFVYHNGWGLPLFHDLDGAARRMVFLHADPAYHEADMPGFSGLLDGALGCCPGFDGFWADKLSDLPRARTDVYRMPIGPSLPPPVVERAVGRPLVLGYAGRIERAQKCLHLVPEFVNALQARGVDFRFEIIGDGSLTPWLRKRTDSRVHFHGWIPSHRDYRRTMAAWDGAVYFSDHEGGPIALLETMAEGAIPFYPARQGSWADHYVPRVDPLCHYPPGDMGAAAGAIQKIFQRPSSEISALRTKTRQLVSDHGSEHYKRSSQEFIARIAGLPRISLPRARRPRVADALPLGVVTRLAPWALRSS